MNKEIKPIKLTRMSPNHLCHLECLRDYERIIDNTKFDSKDALEIAKNQCEQYKDQMCGHKVEIVK